MELKLQDGAYVQDGIGGFVRVDGTEALLQRVLFRLQARRGTFPFIEDLGSRLWQLGRVPAARQQSAAEQYVAEALKDEDLTVRSVELSAGENDTVHITVNLTADGEDLTANVDVG